METGLKVIPVKIEATKFRKRQDDFLRTCQQIRRAWDAMGYTGDPIVELMRAMQGMSIYSSEV